jgi:hypothetical protein
MISIKPKENLRHNTTRDENRIKFDIFDADEILVLKRTYDEYFH